MKAKIKTAKNFFSRYNDLLTNVYAFIMIGLAIIGFATQTELQEDLIALLENKEKPAFNSKALPATLQSDLGVGFMLAPQKGRFRMVDEEIEVDVIIDAPSRVETIGASIAFPGRHFELLDIRGTETLPVAWITEPQFSNSRGVVEFAGVIEGAFRGTENLFTLVFKAKSAGTATLAFRHASALSPDGEEGDIFEWDEGVTYFIRDNNIPSPDLDDDGRITMDDVKILLNNWSNAGGNGRYDLNQDGHVNILDFNILSSFGD